mmetsp:Transcript_45107/g.130240  ORF Transcript_45107/g.130240 Transcript_45107/m.130240 type:complete len:275 (+) Transcript_45107:2134-2958(+)
MAHDVHFVQQVQLGGGCAFHGSGLRLVHVVVLVLGQGDAARRRRRAAVVLPPPALLLARTLWASAPGSRRRRGHARRGHRLEFRRGAGVRRRLLRGGGLGAAPELAGEEVGGERPRPEERVPERRRRQGQGRRWLELDDVPGRVLLLVGPQWRRQEHHYGRAHGDGAADLGRGRGLGPPSAGEQGRGAQADGVLHAAERAMGHLDRRGACPPFRCSHRPFGGGHRVRLRRGAAHGGAVAEEIGGRVLSVWRHEEEVERRPCLAGQSSCALLGRA